MDYVRVHVFTLKIISGKQIYSRSDIPGKKAKMITGAK